MHSFLLHATPVLLQLGVAASLFKTMLYCCRAAPPGGQLPGHLLLTLVLLMCQCPDTHLLRQLLLDYNLRELRVSYNVQ